MDPLSPLSSSLCIPPPPPPLPHLLPLSPWSLRWLAFTCCTRSGGSRISSGRLRPLMMKCLFPLIPPPPHPSPPEILCCYSNWPKPICPQQPPSAERGAMKRQIKGTKRFQRGNPIQKDVVALDQTCGRGRACANEPPADKCLSLTRRGPRYEIARRCSNIAALVLVWVV